MATAAMEMAPGVYRIPTVRFDLVNSFVFLDDDGSVTLVDCGLKSAPARVVAGLAQLGKSPADVQRILLTHAHNDHVGGALALSELTGRAPRLHSDDSALARTGTMAPPDPTVRFGRLMTRLTSGRTAFPAFEPGPDLSDGEVVDVGGGLRVVHTPGHSPGHVAFLHERTGVLVTGDSIFNVRGLRWPVKLFCSDFALTRKTAERLADLDYSVAAFTHGPHVSDRAREQVRGFLAAAGPA